MGFQMVKKSCGTVVLLGSLLTLPISANAELPLNNTVVSQTNRQVPSDESLDKLIDVRHFKKSNDELAQIMQPALLEVARNGAVEIGKIEHLTANQTQQVENAYIKYWQELLQKDFFKALQVDYINNFKTTARAIYNQQEIDAMIEFYSSPIGQQIQNKQTQFDTISVQKLTSSMQNFQQSAVNKLLPKLLVEVSRIKHQVPN